jgi:hypothetical protein
MEAGCRNGDQEENPADSLPRHSVILTPAGLPVNLFLLSQ